MESEGQRVLVVLGLRVLSCFPWDTHQTVYFSSKVIGVGSYSVIFPFLSIFLQNPLDFMGVCGDFIGFYGILWWLTGLRPARIRLKPSWAPRRCSEAAAVNQSPRAPKRTTPVTTVRSRHRGPHYHGTLTQESMGTYSNVGKNHSIMVLNGW